MDREELSNEIGISESVITIALNKGVTLGLWRKGKVYKGKTTQIIQYGIKLGTVLPRDKIEKKRARGQARLTSMMEYVSAADPVPGQLAAPRTSLRDDSLYRAYIRDYFMQNATLPEGEP